MHDPATCPACCDLELYQTDRTGWAKAHAPGFVARLKALDEDARRREWKQAGPAIRAAVRELACESST